jgi:hypothetical protein
MLYFIQVRTRAMSDLGISNVIREVGWVAGLAVSVGAGCAEMPKTRGLRPGELSDGGGLSTATGSATNRFGRNNASAGLTRSRHPPAVIIASRMLLSWSIKQGYLLRTMLLPVSTNTGFRFYVESTRNWGDALVIQEHLPSVSVSRHQFLHCRARRFQRNISRASLVGLKLCSRNVYVNESHSRDEAESAASIVTVTVLSVAPARAGRLFALASVELDIGGVTIEIHGIRALRIAAAGTRIELPQYRDAAGLLRPVVTLPSEIYGPIGDAVLDALIERGLAKRRFSAA